MNKISIGLVGNPDTSSGVTAAELIAVTDGCNQTLKRLGALAECVKLFRVTFEKIEGTETYAPHFQVFFVDPLGTECSHTTDYRFMGFIGSKPKGSPTPTAEEIADHFTYQYGLPQFIREHLKRGRIRLASVNAAFKRLRKAA